MTELVAVENTECNSTKHDFDIFILGPEKTPSVTLFCKHCGKTVDATPHRYQESVAVTSKLLPAVEVPIE